MRQVTRVKIRCRHGGQTTWILCYAMFIYPVSFCHLSLPCCWSERAKRLSRWKESTHTTSVGEKQGQAQLASSYAAEFHGPGSKCSISLLPTFHWPGLRQHLSVRKSRTYGPGAKWQRSAERTIILSHRGYKRLGKPPILGLPVKLKGIVDTREATVRKHPQLDGSVLGGWFGRTATNFYLC